MKEDLEAAGKSPKDGGGTIDGKENTMKNGGGIGGKEGPKGDAKDDGGSTISKDDPKWVKEWPDFPK